MLRNLINETDYGVIKKTSSLYFIFQTFVYLFFVIICLKLIFIILEPREKIISKKIELISPILFDTNSNILAQTITSHRLSVTNFNKLDELQITRLIKDVSKINQPLSNKINNITKNSFHVDRSPEKNIILETLFIGNPDIKLERFPKREYPYSKYTKNLIGKKNIDNEGLSLIEKHVDDYKNNLYLSIDIDLQKKVSDIFKKELLNYQANYGFFTLIDLKKEEIIVNSYDINEKYFINKFDDSVMPSIHLNYEFGSVFKPFTVYSALKYNLLDLSEKFDVHKPLKFFSGNNLVKDLIKSKIPLSTKDILKESSNVGAVIINRKLDCTSQFKQTINELGLLEPVNIIKQIKTVDSIKPKYFTKKGNYCDTMSYGYSLSVTPMHLINAYARMVTGNENFEAKIQKADKDIQLKPNQYSSEINKLLFYANESEHKLYKSCLIAGKTGTANDQSLKENNEIKNNVTYISYFPYHKPRYLALTFMNNPRKSDGIYLTAGNTVKNSYYKILDEILFSLEVSSCEKNSETI